MRIKIYLKNDNFIMLDLKEISRQSDCVHLTDGCNECDLLLDTIDYVECDSYTDNELMLAADLTRMLNRQIIYDTTIAL